LHRQGAGQIFLLPIHYFALSICSDRAHTLLHQKQRPKALADSTPKITLKFMTRQRRNQILYLSLRQHAAHSFTARIALQGIEKQIFPQRL